MSGVQSQKPLNADSLSATINIDANKLIANIDRQEFANLEAKFKQFVDNCEKLSRAIKKKGAPPKQSPWYQRLFRNYSLILNLYYKLKENNTANLNLSSFIKMMNEFAMFVGAKVISISVDENKAVGKVPRGAVLDPLPNNRKNFVDPRGSLLSIPQPASSSVTPSSSSSSSTSSPYISLSTPLVSTNASLPSSVSFYSSALLPSIPHDVRPRSDIGILRLFSPLLSHNSSSSPSSSASSSSVTEAVDNTTATEPSAPELVVPNTRIVSDNSELLSTADPSAPSLPSSEGLRRRRNGKAAQIVPESQELSSTNAPSAPSESSKEGEEEGEAAQNQGRKSVPVSVAISEEGKVSSTITPISAFFAATGSNSSLASSSNVDDEEQPGFVAAVAALPSPPSNGLPEKEGESSEATTTSVPTARAVQIA